MDAAVKYPEKWLPLEFICDCGVKRRVDGEAAVGVRQFEPAFLRAHCEKDREQLVPGRIIEVWEERWLGSELGGFPSSHAFALPL